MHFDSWKRIAVLLFACLTVVATSTVDVGDPIQAGNYQVETDCPDAEQDSGTIAIQATPSVISEGPAFNNGDPGDGMSLTSFGFPKDSFGTSGELAGDFSRGVIEDEVRSCKAVFKSDEDFYLFACHKVSSGKLECTITLERI